MATQGEIVSQIRNHLLVTEPDLDTSTGSVTRKIIDAVAESISEAYIDQHLLTYSYDIDSKTEGDLDAFVQLFGLSRIPARRATGTVTFSRSGGAATIVSIPNNFQLTNAGDPPVVIQTITAAVMNVGELSTNVPVQAVTAGANGNIPPGTLYPLAPLEAIATAVNAAALTGGATQETDLELRDRWKKTVFRNMAGTESMFLGIALNDPDCGAASVLGASKRRREQLQIASGAATSTVTNSQYNYAGAIVGQDLEAGDIALNGVDYIWNTTVNPPRVDVISPVALPDGTLIDLEFDYVPSSSRNNPAANIGNRVDVWCAGTRAVNAVQTIVFRNTLVFVNTPNTPYDRFAYVIPNGDHPVNGNIFIPLAFTPVLTVPGTMVVNGTTYGMSDSTHAMGSTSGGVTYAYRIVHNDTAFGWSPKSFAGLEWHSGSRPSNNSIFTINYTYNGVPSAVQFEIDRWRLITTDAWSHQAKNQFLKFNMAIIYDLNADQNVVNTSINTAISDYLNNLGIAGTVQGSDVLQVVHNVTGVDAVRFLHSGDVGGWNPATPNNFTVGIQRVVDGVVVQSYVDSNGRVRDVFFADNEAPVFGLTYISVRAENTFGTI